MVRCAVKDMAAWCVFSRPEPGIDAASGVLLFLLLLFLCVCVCLCVFVCLTPVFGV